MRWGLKPEHPTAARPICGVLLFQTIRCGSARLKDLVNRRHRDRSFADGRGDALDIAAAHIAYGKDTRTARLKQMG